MDIDTAIQLRHIERLLAVLIGGLSIYLGYRLFLRVPDRYEGESQFKAWNISIVMSRIGPGIFFALFGAAVVGLSFYHAVTVERVQQASTATPADTVPARQAERYSGMGAPAAEADRRADARALLRRDIAILNTLIPKLRADLAEQDRTQVELALPRIKFTLMQPVWPAHAPGWGDPARFEAWLNADAPDPPPADIAAAVDFFRYGEPGAAP